MDEALRLQKPLAADRLQVVASGDLDDTPSGALEKTGTAKSPQLLLPI